MAVRSTLAALIGVGLVVAGAGAAQGKTVIAAAGVIACDPADANFNGGLGISGLCRQKRTANLILERGDYDRVLGLGDQQYQAGTLDNYLASYDLSWGGQLKPLTRPVPGNHEYDDPAGGAKGYFDYFNGEGVQDGPAGTRGQGFYSFDLGPWHLIALNSMCSQVSCGANSPQGQWLQADLEANDKQCVLAYWHFPRFSSGRGGDPAPGGNWGGALPFWNKLYAAGADVVLGGQQHNYERFRPQTPSGAHDPEDGIREFVVGTGGRSKHEFESVRPNSRVRLVNFGVLRMRLLSDRYRWRFRNPDGKLLDSGETDCH